MISKLICFLLGHNFIELEKPGGLFDYHRLFCTRCCKYYELEIYGWKKIFKFDNKKYKRVK